VNLNEVVRDTAMDTGHLTPATWADAQGFAANANDVCRADVSPITDEQCDNFTIGVEFVPALKSNSPR